MQLKQRVTSIQECSSQAQSSYLRQQLLFDVLREFALCDLFSLLRSDCGCRFHSWMASSRGGWWLSVRWVKNMWRQRRLACTPATQWSLRKHLSVQRKPRRTLMFGRDAWRCKPIQPCLLTRMHVLQKGQCGTGTVPDLKLLGCISGARQMRESGSDTQPLGALCAPLLLRPALPQCSHELCSWTDSTQTCSYQSGRSLKILEEEAYLAACGSVLAAV